MVVKRFRHNKPNGPRRPPPAQHLPVLPAETLAALRPQPGQTFVDGTLGAGGHAALLKQAVTPGGLVIGLDLDPAALPRAEAALAPVAGEHRLFQLNFAGIDKAVAESGVERVHGILADLGMSSPQVDDPQRGFSFQREGPLDMRMNPGRGATAGELLDQLDAAELARLLWEWGDEPHARALGAAIVVERRAGRLATTADLTRVVRGIANAGAESSRSPQGGNLGAVARVFQTLRILVNREFANLERLLAAAPGLLHPGGRVAIISFHSGEDRRVKHAFRDGLRAGVYAAISDEPIRASAAERVANARARSAKLRWAERAAP